MPAVLTSGTHRAREKLCSGCLETLQRFRESKGSRLEQELDLSKGKMAKTMVVPAKEFLLGGFG